ncbi:MAG: Gfo/Idh/MocA family oxidoreductase, partial [Bacteroidetes bacterium]|nr:Gfo/Idh/MocA family oxidoreductase [Bacteroidota bacterium]
MPTARRNFLKQLALSGTALAGAYPLLGASDEQMERAAQFQKTAPAFNMCGYAAPKIETVRIGIIGVGMRGSGAVERLSYIEGATVVALGDKYADRIEKAQKTLAGLQQPKAKEYSGEDGWRKMCEDPDIDLIYTCTPWTLHTPIAVYAMTQGKHVATEVPAALTL